MSHKDKFSEKINVMAKESLIPRGALILLLLLVVLPAAIFAYYYWSENRVTPFQSYSVVNLGMREVDVTLAYGKHPDCPSSTIPEGKIMTYTDLGKECNTSVYLTKQKDGTSKVTMICGKVDRTLELSKLYGEYAYKEKLGEPENVSINSTGTSKISNFKKYNLAVEFLAGSPILWCVSSELPIGYASD